VDALIPTPEQEKAITRIVEEPTNAALNGSTMGAGKTLTAVEVCRRISAETILLVAPLGTRLGWKVTFERQGVSLPFKWINSTKAGKQALDDWQWQLPGIYFVGVEYFVRLGWDRASRTKVWLKEPDMVLFDEVHRSQNRHSKTYKTLKQVNGKFKLSMSGTPTGNSFDGAWAVTKWLWPDLIENSYHFWVDRWCKTEYDHFAPGNKKVIGEKNPGDFFNWLPCYIRISSELDVGISEEQVYVELSAQQRRAYEQLEKDMVTWVEGNPIVVEFPITLRMRLRQATLGMFSVDDDGGVTFEDDCKSSKIDAMFQVLADDFEDESALILTDSRKFANVVANRLISQKCPTVLWHGEVSQSDREEHKQQFISGEAKYMVAVTSAIAEGVDGLQHATRNVLWLSRSDNRILNEQALARVLRQGQSRMVRSRELIALDTYYAGVLSSHMEKAIEMNKILREKS
jgi:superfamily II DNA or RNA helicase